MNRLTQFFPLLAGAASAFALYQPQFFLWFDKNFVNVALALIMLFTGFSLTTQDFKRVLSNPRLVGLGFVLQYTIMPALGYVIAQVFALPPMISAGLILVACCPGGTASNVISYLAKADVPLSVTMTATTTIAAAVVTPALSAWLIGNRVPINAFDLAQSTALIILLPLVLALVIKKIRPHLTNQLTPHSNFLAVVLITMIVSSIIARSRDQILEGGLIISCAVFTLHAGGFALGYIASRLLRANVISARTISIEVGMQNSGLGVSLATQHIGALAAVPCAISSLVHSLIGSILAWWFSRSSKNISTVKI